MPKGLQTRAAALAFVTAFAALCAQILMHRMVSAKLMNNYAFFIISLTMLGFAISGTLLSRFSPKKEEEILEFTASCTALFALSFLGVTAVFYHAHVGSQTAVDNPAFVWAVIRWVPLALLYSVPFVFCGLTLGLLLSTPGLPASRIYFYDLAGSALGAVAVLPLIGTAGVERGAALVCALALAAAIALAAPRSRPARILLALGVAAAAAASLSPGRLFDLRYPDGTMLAPAQVPGSGLTVEHVSWDPLSRIEVSRLPPQRLEQKNYPVLIGTNPRFHERIKRMITQNNFAFTYAPEYDGSRASLEGIEETVYSAAYVPRTVANPRVLVVGVGGGIDVLAALTHDAASVTGVEVNLGIFRILRETYRDYFRGWVDDPRVRLVNDEGRHFLAANPDRYDVVQLSGVDSYSGTPGSAHVFSENFLYTAEAFDLYLERLTPGGILCMQRLELVPPRDMLRALVAAVAALRRAGATRPADHIVTVSSTTKNPFTAMLVKRTPFEPAEIERMAAWTRAYPLLMVTAAPAGLPADYSMYQTFLDLGSAGREAAFVSAYAYDLTPPEDDRPFFFRYSTWSHLWDRRPELEGSVPVMEYSVIILLVLVTAAALACILLPLKWLTTEGRDAPDRFRHVVFFAAIGAGYMAVEIALLQKLSVALGHPNYSLSVVLASLLLATGVGSAISGRLTGALGGLRGVSYLLSAVVFLLYFAVFPRISSLAALPFAARAACAAALVAPLGVLLGAFFPTGIGQVKKTAPAFAPWAWGVNGVFSVISPIVGVAISMTWGTNALLLSAIPVYIAAGFALPRTRPE
jgi:spermidine synthase